MGKPNTLRDSVRQAVLDMIQYGELLPGEKVKEAVLCKSLGLSRTPVREALIQLSSEGVLESVSHRGFMVTPRSLKEKNDIYCVLATMDALAAQLAFEHITDVHIHQMNELTDKIDVAIKYQNYPEYCRYQQQFHEVYRNASGNNYLQKLLHDMQEGFIPMTYFSEDSDTLFQVFANMNNEHRAIIRLFEEKKLKELLDYLVNTHWKTQYDAMI